MKTLAETEVPESNAVEEENFSADGAIEGNTPSTDDSQPQSPDEAAGEDASEAGSVETGDDTVSNETEDDNMQEESAVSDEAEAPSQDIEGVLENGDVEVNELNFPDETFRNYIISAYTFNTTGTPILEFDRRSRVTEMDLNGSNLPKKVASLKGIEYFPALTTLDCANNELTELNLTGLTHITTLGCSNNQITTLTTGDCTELRQLWCGNNQIENLDLSALVNLTVVHCNNNNIMQLDISNNVKLEELVCGNILASTLDFSSNPNLKQVSCGGSNLVSINFNDAISSFSMSNSEMLEELDFSNHTELKSVSLSTNSNGETDAFRSLKKMDFTGCTSLTSISAASNSVTTPLLESVILSGTTALTKLELKSDSLITIDLSDCTALKELKIYNAPLTTLDVRTALLLERLELTKASLAENFVLHCWKYTPAETYAQNNGINYQAHEYENYVTVTYETNCEQTVDAQTLMPDSKISEPQITPEDGSKVLGWYLDSGFKQRFDFENMIVTENITLYAKLVSNEKIYIDETTFPDEKFRSYLTNSTYSSNWGVKVEQKYGATENGTMGYITTYYLDASSRTKRIYASIADKEIESLKGIEYFEGLYDLYCSRNVLTELDLSNNIMLESIDCSQNALTDLKLPETGLLTKINCAENDLTVLDVSANPSLTSLQCGYNELTNLDLHNNTELNSLYCESNKLAQLNVSDNTKLETVKCGKNETLSSIDISKADKLTNLDCSNNNIETLDLSHNPELVYLTCNGNNLNELNLSANTKLKNVSCQDNQLGNLNLSGNTLLTSLNCQNNQLESLDLSGNTSLTWLYCENNQFTSLDLSQNINLETLSCGHRALESLDVSKCAKLTSFHCTDIGLELIDLRYNTKLTSLSLGNSSSDNENTVLKGIDLRNNNCTLSGSCDIPDAVTVYCSKGTWIDTWCKNGHSNYSYNDPNDPSGGEDPDDPKPPVDPNPPAADSKDLKDAVVTLTASYVKVKKNNAAQKPVPKKVTLGGVTLKKNRDYTISYASTYIENGETKTRAVDALTTTGRYIMTLSAVSGGKYTGSTSRTIVVTDKKLMSAVKVAVNKVEYTGQPIITGVIKSVKDGKKELREGTDYTVTYKNNTDSGKGTVIITAVAGSEYDGTKEVLFDINGLKITKAKVTGVTPKDFNGTGSITQSIASASSADGVKLTISVKESGQSVTKTLTPDEDFTVSYENNNAAGTAKIVFTGKGLYNGTLKKSFKINKVKLTDAMRDQTPISIVHTKGGAKPDVTIKYGNVKLINGKDYTLSYKKNKAISSSDNKPMITVKGKGSYSGTLKNIPFTITKQNINNKTVINNQPVINITASDAEYISKKRVYGTTIKIYDRGVKLSPNKDYKIKSITENQVETLPQTGYQTATITITGEGNYDGEATVTFNIVETLINKMSAKVTGVHVYNGAAVTLNKSEIVITNKKDKHTLTADEFEIVGYSKNDRAGTASVEVKGLGKYGGTKVIKFKISKK